MCEKRNEQCQFVYFDDMLRKYGNIFQHRKNVNNVMIFWNGGIPPGGPAYKRHKKDNENNENNNDNNNNNNSNVQEWWDPSRRSCLQKTWPSKAAIA